MTNNQTLDLRVKSLRECNMYHNRREYTFHCPWSGQIWPMGPNSFRRWEIATLLVKTLYVKIMHATHRCWYFVVEIWVWQLNYPSRLTCRQIPCKLPYMVRLREVYSSSTRFALHTFCTWVTMPPNLCCYPFLGENTFDMPTGYRYQGKCDVKTRTRRRC